MFTIHHFLDSHDAVDVKVLYYFSAFHFLQPNFIILYSFVKEAGLFLCCSLMLSPEDALVLLSYSCLQ